MPTKYEFHPIANIFPMLPEAELATLAEDIKANGLRLRIALYQGKILDGRNRYLACLRAGVRPLFKHYKGENPIQFCLSVNLHRRHLTTSQRAAIAADVANLQDGQRADYAGASNEAPVTQADAAELLDVSRSAVQRATAVRNVDPELHGKVKAGELSLEDARRTISSPCDTGNGNGEPNNGVTDTPADEDEDDPNEITREEFTIKEFKGFIKKLCKYDLTSTEIRSYIKKYLDRRK